MRTSGALILALFLAACADAPPVGPQFDPDACTDFVVLHQMGLSWARLNHRISTWSVGFDHAACRSESAEITHIGGDFSTGGLASDAPSVEFGWQRAATDPAEIGVARVRLETFVEPGERDTHVEQSFARSALALRHYRRVIALIDGVHVVTGVDQGPDYPADYDPSHGYTVRGFGAGVAIAELTTDAITVAGDLTFHLANSPDRPALNAAIPFARVGVTIDVLLLGIGTAPVHEAEVAYDMLYPEPVPTEDQDIPPPPAEKTTVSIAGRPGAPQGLWGLSSFEFAYQFDGRCAQTNPDCAFFAGEVCEDDGYCSLGREEPGEYLREISVGVDLVDHDPSTGEADFAFVGYTSNASNFVANYALDYDFSGAMVWIQANGAAPPKRLDETFETGAVSYRLDR